ncbi:OsmC family protein [Paenibacillus alvei]|uniref:OsmC-like protein n=1 Tax=Paenibacillus alvei TaxID=44250 RepID=A0A383RIF1_PAEAL|nr:OsmC family protein [Paenibacillus alvei]SYX86613.1 conserved protein of unknown function [Paenibacillus alvei]
MQVHVKEMKSHEWIGSCGKDQIMIRQQADSSGSASSNRSFDLWMMSLAFAVAESIRNYATEKAWDLQSLQVDALDEVSNQGKLLYVTFLITADGLHKEERDEVFSAVRTTCTLLRLVNKDIEMYFADRLANE